MKYDKDLTFSKRSFLDSVDTSRIPLSRVRLQMESVSPGRVFETPLMKRVMNHAIDRQFGKDRHNLVNIIQKVDIIRR